MLAVAHIYHQSGSEAEAHLRGRAADPPLGVTSARLADICQF
jgi:hypothetical protein